VQAAAYVDGRGSQRIGKGSRGQNSGKVDNRLDGIRFEQALHILLGSEIALHEVAKTNLTNPGVHRHNVCPQQRQALRPEQQADSLSDLAVCTGNQH
jgi:hypothetical protein